MAASLIQWLRTKANAWEAGTKGPSDAGFEFGRVSANMKIEDLPLFPSAACLYVQVIALDDYSRVSGPRTPPSSVSRAPIAS